jgi:hypothetical protein
MIKKILWLTIFGSTLNFSWSAYTAIIDTFECSLEYRPQGRGQKIRTRGELSGIRREMDRSDIFGRNVKFTEAETSSLGLEFEHRGEWYSAEIKLIYRHAIEFNEQGQAVRAAQNECHQRMILLPNEGSTDPCNPGWFEDPFSSTSNAWDIVEIGSNNIPKFDVLSLPNGVGTLDIRCELKETVAH